MVVTVVATKSIEKTVSVIRTFSGIDRATKRVKDLENSGDAFHCQLLVDYSNVAFYKEKYEKLFDMFIRKAGETQAMSISGDSIDS